MSYTSSRVQTPSPRWSSKSKTSRPPLSTEGVFLKTTPYLVFIFIDRELTVICLGFIDRYRTNIPESPIHFSGPRKKLNLRNTSLKGVFLSHQCVPRQGTTQNTKRTCRTPLSLCLMVTALREAAKKNINKVGPRGHYQHHIFCFSGGLTVGCLRRGDCNKGRKRRY
jgi:hypothetical protein